MNTYKLKWGLCVAYLCVPKVFLTLSFENTLRDKKLAALYKCFKETFCHCVVFLENHHSMLTLSTST